MSAENIFDNPSQIVAEIIESETRYHDKLLRLAGELSSALVKEPKNTFLQSAFDAVERFEHISGELLSNIEQNKIAIQNENVALRQQLAIRRMQLLKVFYQAYKEYY